MMGLRVCFWVALGISAWVLAGPAKAQDSLDAGKTPAQLFASDCAVCHKSPLGLSKAGGIFGLSSFLRQHYTTSRASASAIADYIEQLDRAAAAEPRKTPPKRAVRRDQSRKPAPAKTDAGKSDSAKTDSAKPDSAKPSETKSDTPAAAQAKATESKPNEAKPAAPKAAESKPSEAKPAEAPKAGKSD